MHHPGLTPRAETPDKMAVVKALVTVLSEQGAEIRSRS
jgi:hypothetical protein